MQSKILFTVLNWGLGHASRSIPIIQRLLSENKKVVLASDGDALELLKKEFPYLIFEQLPAYNIHYSRHAKDFDKTFFLQLKKLTEAIDSENKTCKELVRKHQITEIISDNRYGCYFKKIPSRIICHQINLQHKNLLYKAIMNKIHIQMLDKFDQIWVPDNKYPSLAGEISKTNNKTILSKLNYIGTQSRFEKKDLQLKYDLAIVLSGPEPQRSILEKKLCDQVNHLNKRIAFVRGVSNPIQSLNVINKKIDVFNILDSKNLNILLNQSNRVVCRAGYSSIMDLVALNKKAVLIPTPGQTEQEYLAQYLESNPLFSYAQQSDINIKTFF